MTRTEQLDQYFQQVQNIILSRQDPISGLLPASTAVNAHGNYTDAWVRDNVYSILAAWGLALAYKRHDDKQDRTYLLEQSVVKLMRGLLASMMRQAHKVERFKYSQDPSDALHAKYNTQSGDVVVGDNEWGHLQIDATSLFLLMLAQMTASGLRIIFTLDEVNFVQNLVHYIARAYRIPDFGIWERGNKSNHGIAEINASSVGMAKAALEALSGFNLFGKHGGQASVIHVLSDEIARSRITLQSLLPRESISKEVDAAVLSIIGFPAFAIEDPELLQKTEQRICDRLEGNYGCKRFLRDGHQTAIEDSHRLYYEGHELKQFINIECEWPLFFSYLLLNNLFAKNSAKAEQYRSKIQALLVEQNGLFLLPELYIVPADKIDAERENPHSQQRVANENVPLVWAQSLYILGAMIQDGLLKSSDIDPLGRSLRIGQEGKQKVQLTLLADNQKVKNRLGQLGVNAQTSTEVLPIQVRESGELAAAYTQVGRNKRLGLSGRPKKQIRSLGTAILYRLNEDHIVFLPQFINQRGFYLALDNRLLVERLCLELSYIYQHWDNPGSPLVVMVVKQNMLEDDGLQVLFEFITQLQAGSVMDVPVQLGNLADFMHTTCYEQIDHLHGFKFPPLRVQTEQKPGHFVLPENNAENCIISTVCINAWNQLEDAALIEELSSNSNLYAQLEVLQILISRHGLTHQISFTGQQDQLCSVKDLLEEVYYRAGDLHAWLIVRHSAGLLGKYDVDLEQAATEIIVRLKPLSVGREYSSKATFKRPTNAGKLLHTIREFNRNDAKTHAIIQELIIYLGMLIKSNPDLFADMHTVRVGHIMKLIIARQSRQTGGDMDDAYTLVLTLPPYQLAQQVKDTLTDYQNSESALSLSETLRYESDSEVLLKVQFSEQISPKDRGKAEDWHEWREQRGSMGRDPETFYTSVWDTLLHCKGIIIGDKLNDKRRLDSEEILATMTANEHSFVLRVNHCLDKINSPDYRQLTVEALQALALIFKKYPELTVNDTLLTDTIITHAVRITWLTMHPDRTEQFEFEHALAWQSFYQLPPHQVANGIVDALNYLLDNHNPDNPS